MTVMDDDGDDDDEEEEDDDDGGGGGGGGMIDGGGGDGCSHTGEGFLLDTALMTDWQACLVERLVQPWGGVGPAELKA